MTTMTENEVFEVEEKKPSREEISLTIQREGILKRIRDLKSKANDRSLTERSERVENVYNIVSNYGEGSDFVPPPKLYYYMTMGEWGIFQDLRDQLSKAESELYWRFGVTFPKEGTKIHWREGYGPQGDPK